MADRLVKMLNLYGYQPVFLPRTGLVPPELYNFDNHKLIRLGALAECIPGQTVKFQPTSGDLADLEGEVTSGKNISEAVGFLTNALAVLGIGAPKLDLSFAGSKDFVFAFTKVTYQTVDPLIIDKTLQSITLPLAIPNQYITSGAMHIAYEYAYAGSVTMKRKDGNSFSMNVGADIHQFVHVDSKVKLEVTNNTTLSFSPTGGTVAAFAYKAGRLERNGFWTFKPEIVKHLAGPPGGFVPAPDVVLMGKDLLVEAAA